MSNTAQTLIIIGSLILVLVLSIVMQVFRARRSPLGRAVKIHADLQRIDKFCNDDAYRHQAGRLSTRAWDRYREKIGFLPAEIKEDLTRLFGMVGEINAEITASSRTNSNIYLATIDTGKLRAPVAACREKLKQWISENLQNREYLPKKFGVFRF